jgi:septum formation protein
MNWFPDYRYILASGSPRRQQLLRDLLLPFELWHSDTNEDYPPEMKVADIPVFLARQKAIPFINRLEAKDLLITADTIVCLDQQVLGKPGDSEHAREMLRKLSGEKHQVITGVCLTSSRKNSTFSEVTHVEFKKLSEEEIDYYIEIFQPYDKAGAYGIQEWIGLMGVMKIEGSYFNVVGMPVHRLYEEILLF